MKIIALLACLLLASCHKYRTGEQVYIIPDSTIGIIHKSNPGVGNYSYQVRYKANDGTFQYAEFYESELLKKY